jgi:hypothetical protein
VAERRPRRILAWPNLAGLGSTACGRSFLQGGSQFLRDAEPPRRGLSEGSPTGCVLCLRAAKRSRACEGVAAVLALHPTTTSSWPASGGSERSDSSRRCSRMSAMASRRLSRHSSRDLPWPLAPGTSAQYATYHGPSCSMIAVNSLRMLHSTPARIVRTFAYTGHRPAEKGRRSPLIGFAVLRARAGGAIGLIFRPGVPRVASDITKIIGKRAGEPRAHIETSFWKRASGNAETAP